MVNLSFAERLAAPGAHHLPVLEREVSELMTPGVTSIVESAPLTRVFEAFAAHNVHALLVTGASTGRPLGWITARGLLAWVEREMSLHPARDAVTERAITIRPDALGREALTTLLQEGVTHLLVRHSTEVTPQGVVTELDLVVNTPR